MKHENYVPLYIAVGVIYYAMCHLAHVNPMVPVHAIMHLVYVAIQSL
jgi:hypothetical protein